MEFANRQSNDFDIKLRYLAKQILWLICFVLMSPLFVWGIYTGIQYMNDECVRTSAISLDMWLIFVSGFDILYAMIILVLLCCRASRIVRRSIIWPLNGLMIIWIIFGLSFLFRSHIHCLHDTLWVASLLNIVITTLIALVCLVVLIASKCNACSRISRYISLEETPYDYYTQSEQV